MFDSVLVICVGNICRSPTGERLLQRELPEKIIRSAGISAVVGHAADSSAEEVAKSHGLSLEGHVARQLTREMCRDHDLLLVMERKHIEAVCEIIPEMRGKIMLFGHWDNHREIADPYKQSREAFDFVYRSLEASSKLWATALKN
ncbi:Low molecular weight protein-tyrosine-phosphatase wzb [Serratia grimesii]|jgi:protein-tyrosine phosphatase|uniref:arsenate reductase/protein-tyrosine-phosphatase family protein n=1 Tax=Serratia grimesii TaxID=82995 RepID=UPI002177EE7A|nr:protein tyrosine phosphatase [Serratia grimesii]CAI0795653.1 Low molecular weight protein-tyrosine-phosphatase wzb [Serratia grimesii]CAI2785683.1 Low molecular weight protein-tyrosine-phosphatase wzb [Serratia grimesii]